MNTTDSTIRAATADAMVSKQRRQNITPADVAAYDYAYDYVSRNSIPLTDVSAVCDLKLAFYAGAVYAFNACQAVNAGMLRRESDATVAQS